MAVDPFAYSNLAALVLPSSRYTVIGATQSQMDTGGGALVDSVEITFTVAGRPGVYTVELPIVGFRLFESGLDLTAEAATIEALWNL